MLCTNQPNAVFCCLLYPFKYIFKKISSIPATHKLVSLLLM